MTEAQHIATALELERRRQHLRVGSDEARRIVTEAKAAYAARAQR